MWIGMNEFDHCILAMHWPHRGQDSNPHSGLSRYCLVSLAAVFWMSRNAPSPFGAVLRDIQKTAARETTLLVQMVQSI